MIAPLDFRRYILGALIFCLLLACIAAPGVTLPVRARRVRRGRRRREGEPVAYEDETAAVVCIVVPRPVINFAQDWAYRRIG